MKANLSFDFRIFQRPIGFILLGLPAVGLVWSRWVIKAITEAAISGHPPSQDVSMILADLQSFFRNVVVPVLAFTLTLAAVNLVYCFVRPRK